MKQEVALPIAAKLWLFTNRDLEGITIYIDGHHLIQGKIQELLNKDVSGYLQASEKTSFYQYSFVVRATSSSDQSWIFNAGNN